MLPDGSDLLLTEDIADRVHTHSADLQFTYEKNTALRFFNNTLSLSGRWDEGRGTVFSGSSESFLSSGADGDGTYISQASHYRSLGVANRSRLVHRTARGEALNGHPPTACRPPRKSLPSVAA